MHMEYGEQNPVKRLQSLVLPAAVVYYNRTPPAIANQRL